MNKKSLDAFKEHAKAEYPKECCGLLLSVARKERYYPCNNSADDPVERFRISGEDYSDAEEVGEIIAVCHSHPNGSSKPSDADRVKCEAYGMPWHILSIGKCGEEFEFGEMGYIEPSGYEAPLIGRQFSHGILDCYTLMQDWFSRERGITLSQYSREDDWWDKGQELYSMDRLNAEGFTQVSGEIQVGDMILMCVRSKVPNHAAVYIGNGEILHHLHGRLSRRDVYGGYWAESTAYIVRHKDMKNV